MTDIFGKVLLFSDPLQITDNCIGEEKKRYNSVSSTEEQLMVAVDFFILRKHSNIFHKKIGPIPKKY